jgi:hypothetical protein
MTNFFRITICSCLCALVSLAGPRLHAQRKDTEKIKRQRSK